METPQHAPHRRRARIAPRRPDRARALLCALRHRAELHDLEHPPAAPEPRLPVQHRAAVLEPDRGRDRRHDRKPQRRQRHRGERDDRQIERPLVAIAPHRAAAAASVGLGIGHDGGSRAMTFPTFPRAPHPAVGAPASDRQVRSLLRSRQEHRPMRERSPRPGARRHGPPGTGPPRVVRRGRCQARARFSTVKMGMNRCRSRRP